LKIRFWEKSSLKYAWNEFRFESFVSGSPVLCLFAQRINSVTFNELCEWNHLPPYDRPVIAGLSPSKRDKSNRFAETELNFNRLKCNLTYFYDFYHHSAVGPAEIG